MKQRCKFTREANSPYLVCRNCHESVKTDAEDAIKQCAAEIPDPPERDPETVPCIHRGDSLRKDKANVPGTRGEGVSVFACQQRGECSLEAKLRETPDCISCRLREAGHWKPEFAPIRGMLARSNPWEGLCVRKPWEYDVAAFIPVLDCVDMLPQVIECLRLQTLRPYIVIVDTGSTPENFAKVEALRAEDLEVHCLRLNGFQHASQSVAMSCDVAFSVCQSRFLFLTHSDCFLRSRTVLEEFANLCQDNPVVGYQISPRRHADWKRMCGHTATMVDMDAMHEYGISWNFRRLCRDHGVPVGNSPDRPSWPDTEIGFNYLCQEAGIEPLLIGTEQNYIRTLDDRIDHVRSFPSSALYAPQHYSDSQQNAADAIAQANARIADWRENPLPETQRVWRSRRVETKTLPEFMRNWSRNA